MTGQSWAQHAIDRFFEGRESPTQSQCDDDARTISGASLVQAVQAPGSLSYTVICIGCRDQQQNMIVSFRNPGSMLGQEVIQLAKSVHGVLVPEAIYHGPMTDAHPPLHIYTMPYLPGISCLEALSAKAELSPDEEARHRCYVKHLARYFARCWSNPQHVDAEVQAEYQEGVHRRLSRLKASSRPILSHTTISELEDSIPFDQTWPQVLTHNDLSQTNILVHEKTFEITGIVDWSMAGVLPFGMELESVLLATGYMDLSGGHDCTCRQLLLDDFWDEFWHQCRVDNGFSRQEIRDVAMQTSKLGAVLHYAFQRNDDGSSSEELTTSEWSIKTLNAVLRDPES